MLTQIELWNFRCYEYAKIVFGSGQLSVVIGQNNSDYSDSNGSGKTTLMYAICWLLYGTWPNMDSAESPVRRSAGRDCVVSGKIETQQGSFVITRARNHHQFKSGLFINGQTGDTKAMQEQLSRIIGMTFEVFTATMIFTGDASDSFARKTDTEQKKILNALLPVDFTRQLESVKQKIKGAETLVLTGDSKLMSLAEAKAEFTRKLDDATRNNDAWQRDQQEFQTNGRKHLETLKAAQEITLETAASAKQGVMELRGKIEAIKKNDEAWRKTAEQWAASGQSIMERSNLLQTREREIAYHANLFADLNTKILDLDAKAANAQAPGRQCPACGTTLTDPNSAAHLKQHHEKAAAELRNQFNATRERHATSINNIDNRLKALPQMDDTEHKIKLAEFNQKYAAYKTEVAALERTLHGAVSALDSWDAHVRKNELAIKELETKLSAATTENPYARSVVEFRQMLATNEEKRTVLETECATAKSNKAVLDQLLLMFGGGKGSLHHYIFETMLPELTATAQMFLKFLSAGTLNVEFKSFRQDGKKTIEGFFIDAAKADSTDSYSDLSGGERRRIDVAVFLTLYRLASRNVFSPGVLMLDEVADTLDETGQQNLLHLLDFFCREYGVNCLLLTNVRELVASVPSGYHCEASGNASRLVPFQES